MEGFNQVLAALGGLTLLLGLLSKWLERIPFSAPLAALCIGVLLGPAVLGVLDLSALTEDPALLENVARITLAIALSGVAMRIPAGFIRKRWRQMSLLIGLAMPLMWVISTALIMLCLHLDFWLSALIAAIVTPTDPVASSTVVTGVTGRQCIPETLRHAISLESGANDGLAYPFVLLPLLMLTRDSGEAWKEWLTRVWLRDIGLALLLGVASGYLAAKLVLAARDRDLISEEWGRVYMAALALFAVACGGLLGCNEVLLVFLAGVTFAQVVGDEAAREHERTLEAINRFFSIPIFAVLGTLLPWHGWRMLGWPALLLVIAMLLLRRIPVLLLLRPLLGNVRSLADALLMGWFGPIAVAALYYIAYVEQRVDDPRIWPVATAIICASALAHGVTGAPFTRLYGRMHEPHADRTQAPGPEQEVPESGNHDNRKKE
jgi:NhaP-type Na+/H+ or K+/H+ antiporter